VALRNGELLINAGLMGTGIEQWRRLIIHLQERGLVVRRVLAIAISNNSKRAVWSWKPEEIKCFDEAICPADFHAGLWLPAAADDSRARLIERGAERFSQRFPDAGVIDRLKWYLRYYSYVYKFADHANESLKALIRSHRRSPDTLQLQNEAGLQGLKGLGVPLHVLMIPQRNELGGWWEQPDILVAATILQRHGVPYTWCPLTTADYLKNDGHPSRAGYDKIVACADKALDQTGTIGAG
jgi:hypothetical protein